MASPFAMPIIALFNDAKTWRTLMDKKYLNWAIAIIIFILMLLIMHPKWFGL